MGGAAVGEQRRWVTHSPVKLLLVNDTLRPPSLRKSTGVVCSHLYDAYTIFGVIFLFLPFIKMQSQTAQKRGKKVERRNMSVCEYKMGKLKTEREKKLRT